MIEKHNTKMDKMMKKYYYISSPKSHARNTKQIYTDLILKNQSKKKISFEEDNLTPSNNSTNI